MNNDQDLEINKSLVRKFLKSLYEFDMETARGMMHPESEFFVQNVTVRPNRFSGPEMAEFIQQVGEVIPEGFKFEIIEMTAEENRVSTVVNGFARTIDDTEYNNRYHFLHYIRDGLILKQLEYIDSYLAAKVLGPIMLRLKQSP